MQDTLNGTSLKAKKQYTGEDLAKALGIKWRSLYKYLNDNGQNYNGVDQFPPQITEMVIQKYALTHHYRPAAVTNAARTLAKELGIEIDDYSLITEENVKVETPKVEKKPRRPRLRKPIPIKGAVESVVKDKPFIAKSAKSFWNQFSIYLVLLYISAVIFVSFDGFSAAFIILQTYVDIGKDTDGLLAAVMEIKTNPILLYGTIVGALAGIFIGFIAIGSIVNFRGDKEYKNALKGSFALYQFVLHFMAMPQKNAGMIVLSLGLTIGTFGCTIAIDNKLNSK